MVAGRFVILAEATNNKAAQEADSMSKQTQKEAVYVAIMSVFSDNGVKVESGKRVNMSREYRAIVNQILFQGFKSGRIELATPEILASDEELRNYVSGLQSNWLRKDTRLNGGEKYKPENPGIRTGTGDTQLKALRQLMSTMTVATERAEVQQHINARIAQLRAANKPKKPAPKIDVSQLPAALKKYAASAVA